MADDLENRKKQLDALAVIIQDVIDDERDNVVTEGNTSYVTPISKDELASIDRGLADVAAGRVHPHSEVRKIYERFL